MGYNKDMFFKAFKKTAMMSSSISPEHYYEMETDKYPHVGANAGALAGAAAGAYKGAKGKKSGAALVGAGVGGAVGALTGHQVGKFVKGYKVGRLMRAAEEMRLRSTPSRSHSYEE